MAYALTNGPHVIRLADGAVIPPDPENTDRAAFDAWVAEGGTPQPAAAPAVSFADYKRALAEHIDATAAVREYENGVSCASYAQSTIATWAAEAVAFIAWRDACYASAFGMLGMVEGGAEPPSIEEFLAAMPVMEWPA